MPIFNTGAFLQQCFAVHPLSLSFKMVTLPDKVGILCANCNMRHRLTVAMSQGSQQEEPLAEEGAVPQLKLCAKTHSEDLRVSGVNVESDSVQLRCRECNRTYQFHVSLFETYQP
ncbi:MAG: hypothetical protein R3351_00175 [Nitrospirales bacterium]|nr:hypothetical protein [Nitrospirales bacterium]